MEKIEYDRIEHDKKGCIIIGSPGIGKTHFSLYVAFYITRRYPSSDIIYEQLDKGDSPLTLHIRPSMNVMKIPNGLRGEYFENSFYIADSVIPSRSKMIFTFLITTPKNNRWHEFSKGRVRKYYAPIWTEDEIWNVWKWNQRYDNRISETRVKELITRWGCIPRRVFDEYDEEPKIEDIISQCDAYAYLKNGGGDLSDNYSGKAIHINPTSDFTDKEYLPASTEICMALYRHYENHTKSTIVNIIRNFAKGAGGTLAGKFFEMMAHDILRKGGDFTVRRLTNDGYWQPEEVHHLEKVAHKQFCNVDEITSGYYNIPNSTNFESVDAIAPGRNGIHHLYQITTAETHNTKVNICIYISFVSTITN